MLEKIGKYEVRLQIGRGAMGVVYEGFDPSIGRRVAIKTLRTELFEPRQMPDVLARFKREAQSAGRLSHPHIVTIHEYGEHEATAYIVMEYISGNELGNELNRGVRFPLEDVVRLMTQLLGALGHAHEHGVVHRDLKPANMFLLEDGSLKVVDFGIARVEASDLTDTGAMLGTPAYMSPEQCLGTQVGHRSDIFSAGVILYQLLTGDRPFTGSVTTIIQKVLRQEPLPPSELNPTLSPAWDKVVARAMAKKPEARYESARQFAEAVKMAFTAERVHEGEVRRKAAEAEEHARRGAEERSRAESLRRAEDERREAERRAKAEMDVRRAAEARARREAEERTVAMAKPSARGAPAIAAVVLIALGIVGAALYYRQGVEEQAAKADAARVAAEAQVREETEKRAKAEALAREESEKRSKLETEAARKEAETKREAELAARARAEEEAKKAAEEKAKALVLMKEEGERKKAELAAKKEADAKALAEAEARRKAEEQAKAEAAKKAEETRRKTEVLAKQDAEEKAKAEAAKKAQEARQAAQKPGAVFRDCPDCPRMVVIPAGEFTMGSPSSEEGRYEFEGPQHTVRIGQPFGIGRSEVTVGEFRRFVRDTGRTVSRCSVYDGSKWNLESNQSWEAPGFAQSDDHPVACVSWQDATAYAQWLSKRTGKQYRLPTEAEWEYAARAGSRTARIWGDSPNDACAYANVADQAEQRKFANLTIHDCDDGHVYTAPVAAKRPNAFGLYDMLGNVWEWTEDCWNGSYGGAPSDGSAWLAGDCSRRVLRGGSWNVDPRIVRSAYRLKGAAGNRVDFSGFRLARTLEKEEGERKKAELAAKKEADAKALAEAEARRKAEEQAKADADARRKAEEQAKAQAAKKAEEARPAAQRPGTVFQDCPDCPRMVVIPAGQFTMGSPASEPGRYSDEGPQHRVVISRPFSAGIYEVTFDEWDACARENGCSHNPGDAGWGRGSRPVINVSWRDAKQYAEWLSRKTGKRYRLLTEAEWEYAARAGTTTAYSTGETIASSQAKFGAQQTVPVGSHAPNAFGLFDMHGNVWEWTEDCWNSNYNGAPTNGSAWLTGDCSQRVFRGGSWSDVFPRLLRSANRGRNATVDRSGSFGFRLARTLE